MKFKNYDMETATKDYLLTYFFFNLISAREQRDQGEQTCFIHWISLGHYSLVVQGKHSKD